MGGNVKTQIGKIIGKTLNSYYPKVKPVIDDLKYKQEYQDRIIECMVSEVDDNYITTPETDNPIVKLEHSKEGLVKVPTVKGKTILVDADGNETDTPAEGCKLLSVGEQEDNKLIILSRNKNLFDGDFMYQKSVMIEDGSVAWNPARVTSNFIRVYPNTNYIKTNVSGYVNVWTTFYDNNFNYLGQQYAISSSKFTTPSNSAFIRLSIQKPDISEINKDDLNILNSQFQLEVGQQSTSYVEPKHHKTEILLDEPLRKIPNGACDEIVGNKLIRRIGKIILDGSETWTEDNVKVDERLNWSAYTRLNNMKSHTSYREISHTVYCGRFEEVEYDKCTGSIDDKKGIATIKQNDSIQRILLSVDKNSLHIQDVYGFIQWLSENPIEVLYELKEPIIEELPNSITLQGFDDTTMYIENSITPTVSYGYNALIPYKQELLNQQEEVEVNTLDIENNIIPYLMDMEFNLIMMEDEE